MNRKEFLLNLCSGKAKKRNFEALVAPADFDEPGKYSQFGCRWDLHDLLSTYIATVNDKAYAAYEFDNSVTSVITFNKHPERDIYWHETLADGTNNSGFITGSGQKTVFTNGSNSRYVIMCHSTSNTGTVIQNSGDGYEVWANWGIKWMYCTKRVVSFESINIGYGSSLKYVFHESLDKLLKNPFAYAFPSTNELYGVINIPKQVEIIGFGAFSNCPKVYGSLDLSNIKTIGAYAFQNDIGIDELKLNKDLESIGGSAFIGCSNLNGKLIIPNKITTISNSSFRKCSSFNGLELPEGLLIIEDNSFRECSGFVGNLILPSTLTGIGITSFHTCPGFTGSLIIPNSVKTVSFGSFANCVGFSNLYIPNSVNYVGGYAFTGCSGLKKIELNLITNSSVETTTLAGCGNVEVLKLGDNFYTSINGSDSLSLTFSNKLCITEEGKDEMYLNLTQRIVQNYGKVVLGAINLNNLISKYPNVVAEAAARGIIVT